jgi:hypothetical protein
MVAMQQEEGEERDGNKVALGQVSATTSVCPANSHSTKYSMLIFHLGLVQ